MCLPSSRRALLLADLAWTKWRSYDPYTVDDITAMVIDMQVACAFFERMALRRQGK